MNRRMFEQGMFIRLLIVLAAASLLGATACNGQSPRASRAKSGSPAAQPDLTRFLLGPNEEPGLGPQGKPEIISTAGEVFEGSADDEKRLREEGFEVFVVQMLEGESNALHAGVTNVMLFATAEGANRELLYMDSRVEQDFGGSAVERFSVPGVPSAKGVTAREPGGQNVGNVSWIQGRCLLALGYQGEDPLVERVRAAVKAIYERTAGGCP